MPIDYAALAEKARKQAAGASPTAAPVDEAKFQAWYADAAKKYDLDPNPEGQHYDYRAAFRAGATPDATKHWPSDFKQAGHPNEIVGGFNTRTGARVPGTVRMSEADLVKSGWDPAAAKRLSALPEAPATVDYAALAEKARGAGAKPSPAEAANKVRGEQDAAEAALNKGSEGSALGRFASNLGSALNPVTAARGIVQAVSHPVDTYHGMVDASAEQFGKAGQAFNEGRYSEAVGHGVAGALPVVGPAAAAAGEQIGSGDVAGGLGAATGLLAPFGAGKAVQVARGALPARAAAVVNPTVEFARARGIPLDAATVSDNLAVKGTQALADRSLAGSGIATRAKAAQATAMERVGGELADTAHPAAVTAEEAGTKLRTALTDKIKTHNVEATTAYDTLRAIEAKTPMPVNLTAQKAALKPLYDSLMRSNKLVPLQGGKGRALVALDRLMDGPDVAPLADVDAALGDLKAMARADIPELRTAGQGTAAAAVKELDTAVRGAAMRAGPQAYDALTTGRKATVAKYQVADVLDELHAEPVKTVQGLTAPKDSAIQKLRAVTSQAPGVTPELARAYLEDLLAKPQKVADWRKLGPETKATLFPDVAHVKALDQFFDLTDRISKTNVNPSGSGYIAALAAQGAMVWTNPLTSIPLQLTAGTLATLMRSPTAIDALTQGLRLPRVAPMAAKTAATAKLLKAAAQVGVNLESAAVPLAAEADPGDTTAAGPGR